MVNLILPCYILNPPGAAGHPPDLFDMPHKDKP